MMTRVVAVLSVLAAGWAVAGALPVCGPWQWSNPLPQGSPIYGIAHGNHTFVAVGAAGTILTSADGASWTIRASGTSSDLLAVAWSGARFVAVGGAVVTSADGIAWTAASVGLSASLTAVAWTGQQFIAAGSRDIVRSADGATWRQTASDLYRVGALATNGAVVVAASDSGMFVFRNTPSLQWELRFGGRFYDVIWTGERFVAVGYGSIATSVDGLRWGHVALLETSLRRIVWAGGLYAGITPDGQLLISTDLAHWSGIDTPSGGGVSLAVAWGDGTFVAGGTYGMLLSSRDGSSWQPRSSGLIADFTRVRWTGSEYLLVGTSPHGESYVVASPDGRTGSVLYTLPAGMGAQLRDAAHGPPGYVAVGTQSTVVSSPDGASWQAAPVNGVGASELEGVVWADGRFVALGSGPGWAPILTSEDGGTWIARSSYVYSTLNDAAWTGNRYVAVGGRIVTCPGFCCGGEPVVVTSQDGSAWTVQESPAASEIFDVVVWTGGRLVATGFSFCRPSLMESTDGVSWEPLPWPDSDWGPFTVTWSGSFLAALASKVSLPVPLVAAWMSADGATWAGVPGRLPPGIVAIASSGREIVAVGQGGAVLRSSCPEPRQVRRRLERVGEPASPARSPARLR